VTGASRAIPRGPGILRGMDAPACVLYTGRS